MCACISGEKTARLAHKSVKSLVDENAKMSRILIYEEQKNQCIARVNAIVS